MIQTLMYKFNVPRQTNGFLLCENYKDWDYTCVIKYIFTDWMGRVQCVQQVVSTMRSVLAFNTALTAITLMLAGFKSKCDVKL